MDVLIFSSVQGKHTRTRARARTHTVGYYIHFRMCDARALSLTLISFHYHSLCSIVLSFLFDPVRRSAHTE